MSYHSIKPNCLHDQKIKIKQIYWLVACTHKRAVTDSHISVWLHAHTKGGKRKGRRKKKAEAEKI